MSKRPTVEPVWLDRMLVKWGIRSLKLETAGLGYPRICPMLKEGIPTPARSYEPTGYSLEDFDQLEKAVDSLEMKYRLVITRAYKPWKARDIEMVLRTYEVTDRTWRNWLTAAARQIEISMNRAQHDGTMATGGGLSGVSDLRSREVQEADR